jgi:ankyrin repeat protein
MFAAFSNHALCANELLKAGADITLQNSNLDTVFGIAVKRGSKQGLYLYLKHHLSLLLQIPLINYLLFCFLVQIILEKHVLQLIS